MNKCKKKFFLVGIKGTGMCALARALKEMGNIVKGSDVKKLFFTDNILKENKIEVVEFDKENIKGDYIYIISSNYNQDNVEVQEILSKEYEYYYYNVFIEYFFKNKIGISGTHGKTTTTSFLVDLFNDERISAVIGDGTGIGNDEYKYFIFEACEYKKNILTYSFDYLVINNIEEEHLDCYKDINEIYDTFIQASLKSKVLICNENINISHPNKYTFGKNENNYSFYNIIEKNNKGYKLLITIDKKTFTINFPFYGEHMICNLLAGLTVYYLIIGNLNNIKDKINSFRIPNRRMNEYIVNETIIIDDYAHHPTEIEALLNGINQKYSEKQIAIIFQPHTYSRTISLEEKFKECFNGFEEVYIRKTYNPNREKYSNELEARVKLIFESYKEFKDSVINNLLVRKNQVIVFIGAGDNYNYIEGLIKNFK